MGVNGVCCYYNSYLCSSVYLGNNDSKEALEYSDVFFSVFDFTLFLL